MELLPLRNLAGKLLGLICCCSAIALIPTPRVQAQSRDYTQEVHQEAIDTYSGELQEARQQGNREAEVRTLYNAGRGYQYFGDFEQAIELLNQALELARKYQEDNLESQVLGQLAIAHHKQGDEYGLNFLNLQLQGAREQGNTNQEKHILSEMLGNYFIADNYPQVLAVAAEYFPLIENSEDKSAQWQLLSQLAATYMSMGEFEQAAILQRQALAIVLEIYEASPVIRHSHGLIFGRFQDVGNVYHRQGNYDEAISYYVSLFELAQKVGDAQWVYYVLQDLAKSFAAKDDPEEVTQILNAAIGVAQDYDLGGESEIRTLDKLSLTHAYQGDYEEALAIQNKCAAKEHQIQQDLPFYQALGACSLDNLGFLHFRAGNLAEAENYLRQHITRHEEQIQTFITPQKQNLSFSTFDRVNIVNRELIALNNRILQEILVAQNRLFSALEISEQGRARSFYELLASRYASNSSQRPQFAPPKLEKIKQIAQQTQSTLVEYSLIYDEQPNYLGELKFGGEKPVAKTLLIWVIKPNGETKFAQVDLRGQRTKLSRLIAEARGRRGKGLKQLHEILIAPIAEELPTQPEARVTFIPNDALFLVPFPALRDADSTYLIEKHTILTAPSIQVLGLIQENQSQNKLNLNSDLSALVVGNPTMPKVHQQWGQPPQPIASLPGSEAEAQTIAELLKTKALMGSQATETEVVKKLPQAQMIHIASHGFLDNYLGLRASIALTPTPEDDGFLTIEEVINLPLEAKLVVLSACNTARGEITGDGVVGLTRSFIAAGAESVLSSLWLVPDDATAFLMSEFYQQLVHSGDSAQALRQAMLKTKEEFPNHLNWAAFTLVGG